MASKKTHTWTCSNPFAALEVTEAAESVVATPASGSRLCVPPEEASSGETRGNRWKSPQLTRADGSRVAKESSWQLPLEELVKPGAKQGKKKRHKCGSIAVCTEVQPRRACLQPVEDSSAKRLQAIQGKLAQIGMPDGIDITKWETLSSIVDSGATVPVMHPNIGSEYELKESAASRAGIEYEVANDETIPNVGEKHMAVITQEGTIRGYGSQCSEVGVGKALQSVRSLGKSGHSVLFHVGPNGDKHIIVNRTTGEINEIQDDGLNYVQKLAIVPPE